MSDLAQTVTCPYCAAKPGNPCRVPSTGRLLAHRSEGHSSRSAEVLRRKSGRLPGSGQRANVKSINKIRPDL